MPFDNDQPYFWIVIYEDALYALWSYNKVSRNELMKELTEEVAKNTVMKSLIPVIDNYPEIGIASTINNAIHLVEEQEVKITRRFK